MKIFVYVELTIFECVTFVATNRCFSSGVAVKSGLLGADWVLTGCVLTNSQSRPKSDGTRNFAQGGTVNFPDVLRTICDTCLPILQSAFGIDSTLPLPRPYTSLGTQHRYRYLIYEWGRL